MCPIIIPIDCFEDLSFNSPENVHLKGDGKTSYYNKYGLSRLTLYIDA